MEQMQNMVNVHCLQKLPYANIYEVNSIKNV